MRALPPPSSKPPASSPKDEGSEPRTKTTSIAGQNEEQKDSKEPDMFQELEPKVRQQIKIVGRTLFCFRCEGSKEMAGYYCACGSFLCSLHLAEHSCLVSASLQYNEEVLQALA